MEAPTVQWVGGLSGIDLPVPDFDMDALLFILGLLLGIGGLRTFEKAAGWRERYGMERFREALDDIAKFRGLITRRVGGW
tara:strand:- start:344 stop:583 length:240 start_codon:yes stop_codon:yes gene_type:complete